MKHGSWKLSELADVPQNGLKVFSAFHCGGGSTMGYKLAGYDVLGGVEIDPDMMAIYRANHKPKHSYLMPIQEFNELKQLPDELFDLDILDGSPPCTSFSTSNVKREEKWGKEAHFREGQATQRLDNLFFHFIKTASILKPKVVIAENVVGLLKGRAKGYVKEIVRDFKAIGYRVQLFKLCASKMGVPQSRGRVFFICSRIEKPLLKLAFNEPCIPFKSIDEGKVNSGPLTKKRLALWCKTIPGRSFAKSHPKGSFFNHSRAHFERPLQAVVSSTVHQTHPLYPRLLSNLEIIKAQTFPLDFNFMGQNINYVCGMSVPPFMMQRIALEVQRQWFE